MVDITEIMDITKFPELYCSLCNNLLSVPPILMNVYGTNVCGRCESDASGGGFNLRNVSFEVLARHVVFPCKFKKEGCIIEETFSKMKTHEEKCPYQTKNCAIETCEWSGIPTELIIHYKKYHKQFIRNSVRKELVDDVGGFILTTEGFYFFIEWSCTDLEFHLSVKNLQFLELDCDITFSYSVWDVTKILTKGLLKINKSVTVKYRNKAAPCYTLSVNAVISEKDFLKKTEALKKIICPNCHCNMIPPILMCPVGHLTCVDCTTNDYDYCKTCDDDEIRFKHVPELDTVAVSSIYNCKYCEQDLSIRDVQDHQRVCSKRLHSCVHCDKWKGIYDEIGRHIISCTWKDNSLLFTDTEITVLGTIAEGNEYSLLIHREQFYVLFIPFSEGPVQVALWNCGPCSLHGWYQYEVFLNHCEDVCFPFNKMYILRNNSSNGRYEVTIPAEDFARFGGNVFTKITVRVNLLSGKERHENVAQYFKWFKR